MATIFYSLMGEGRGHATRVRAMVEQLRGHHRIVIFTYGDALEFLGPLYSETPGVEVRQIEGLRFAYTCGKLDVPKTFVQGLRFRLRVGRLIDELVEQFQQERPQLVLTDFEPLVPRTAVRMGVPYVSLDHQHFAVAYDLSSLPWRLRMFAWGVGRVVRMFHRWQAATIVSGFFFPPLRWRYRDCIQVGTLLRPELLNAAPSDGETIISYLRPHTQPHVLEALKSTGRRVKIYGLGERPADGPLEFCAIHERRFIEDLAGCHVLIGAAGNQLLGETLYFGKPALALPEASHHEQLINSHFVRQMGAGDWVPLERVTGDHVKAFLRETDRFRENIHPLRSRLNGTSAALTAIEPFLGDGVHAAHVALPSDAVAR